MPTPVFMISPGHSYSSVVAAMIGQHPQAYGLPEMNLFLGDTLGEAEETFSLTGRPALPGLKRTLAQLHHGVQTFETVELATEWIRTHRHYAPRQVYDHLQELVGDRILLDKSPSTSMSQKCLQNLVTAFPDANVIQLLRHPRSRSLSRLKSLKSQPMMRVMQGISGNRMDLEHAWFRAYAMIHDFGRQLAPGQMIRLHGENFLRNPRLYLVQICEWLDISTEEAAIEAMLHPEESPYSSVGPQNAKGGTSSDFLKSPALDFDRLAQIKDGTLEGEMEWEPGRHFSEATRELASWFGYR
jgi:hypothetical protein